jgi:pimeloyl-ACP methyl ester carboxylesterase
MNKFCRFIFFVSTLVISDFCLAQSDSIVLRDITWDKNAPAGFSELFIPTNNALLAGFLYRANGNGKHPTVLMLHGFPGNERNLDLAQVIRSHGWNVIYFDYRGSWGSQGKFSFNNCVDDVVNVVAFCKKYQDSLKIDPSKIVLFGHSMGGWVCLKSLQRLPEIKKGFALSTWDIPHQFKRVLNEKEITALSRDLEVNSKYFVLNTTPKELFAPVFKQPESYNLANDANALGNQEIIMLDEDPRNKQIAESLKSANKAYFDYQIWETDHSFTNKRVSLMNKVLAFLDK